MEREMIINSLEEMCDLMCGCIEDDCEDCTEKDNKEKTED